MAAIPAKKLTAYFQEAHFKDDNVQLSLEQAIRAAMGQLPLVPDRIIAFSTDFFTKQLLNEYEEFDDHIAISVVEYEEGGAASVVQTATERTNISCEELKADSGEIIRRDAMAIIQGNNIISAGPNRGYEMLRGHLPRLFDKANILNSDSPIYLTSKANRDVVRLIADKGVSSISVCSTIQLAEVLNASRDSGQTNYLSDLLAGLTLKDRSVSEDVTTWVQIKKSTRRDSELDEAMIKYATQIIDGDSLDEYAIFLKGQTDPIRGGSIIKKEQIEVARHGSSVRSRDAWTELQKLLGELDE